LKQLNLTTAKQAIAEAGNMGLGFYALRRFRPIDERLFRISTREEKNFYPK
jgi:hypothetical protein